jgi:hypothetical protein
MLPGKRTFTYQFCAGQSAGLPSMVSLLLPPPRPALAGEPVAGRFTARPLQSPSASGAPPLQGIPSHKHPPPYAQTSITLTYLSERRNIKAGAAEKAPVTHSSYVNPDVT